MIKFIDKIKFLCYRKGLVIFSYFLFVIQEQTISTLNNNNSEYINKKFINQKPGTIIRNYYSIIQQKFGHPTAQTTNSNLILR